jgi:hypothetical protein
MLASDVPLSTLEAESFGDAGGLYAARLVDAAQDALVVILVDQRAGAALGGALVGLPKVGRDEQAEHGMTHDTLEGLNEICNNLGGLIKRSNPRAPATLCPLEPCDVAKLPWLASPAKTLGFGTPDGGALWLVAR